ncbi:acyl-CoA dehydrogenase family protein [Palleronia abyssalis]|uniref:Acyl-CoA dehydrogenase FadE27 n=1 Tax=Palleronia abyssalis TaxID=1501240 RepID=A0A2R8BZ13_9RHOB|nr:acyl-CoA dehydrogenase family protein [Palleronia abyssalis]SPJ25415.1 Acyl-CoA dehydrogenase FadE27 [Palleronia abyssalis]
MTIGFHEDEFDTMLTDSVRRALDAGAGAAALGDLGLIGPVGGDLTLVSAAIVAREAARAGIGFPVAATLCHATLTGQAGKPETLRAVLAIQDEGGGIHAPLNGDPVAVLLPEEGATSLLGPVSPGPTSDPLGDGGWAQLDPATAETRQIDLRCIAWTLTAAEILGAAEALLDAAVVHLSERQQFGRKLGSYQALRHRAADDWVRLQDIRTAVDLAAVAHDQDAPEAIDLARIALAVAADHGPIVAENAIHAHGAMGFTWDMGLHHRLISIRQRAATGGGAARQFAAIGAARLACRKKETAGHGRA